MLNHCVLVGAGPWAHSVTRARLCSVGGRESWGWPGRGPVETGEVDLAFSEAGGKKQPARRFPWICGLTLARRRGGKSPDSFIGVPRRLGTLERGVWLQLREPSYSPGLGDRHVKGLGSMIGQRMCSRPRWVVPVLIVSSLFHLVPSEAP